jgi:hypothetical protein
MPVGRPRLPPSDDPVVQAKREKARAYAQEGRDKAKVRTAKAKAGATIAGAIKRKLATPKKKKVDDNRLHNLPEDLQRKIMKMAYVPPTKKELRIEYSRRFSNPQPIYFRYGRGLKDFLKENYPQIVRRFYRRLDDDDVIDAEWNTYGKGARGVILLLQTGNDEEPVITLRIRWSEMNNDLDYVFDNEMQGWLDSFGKKSSDNSSSGSHYSFPNVSTPSVMSYGSLAGSYSGNLSGSSFAKTSSSSKSSSTKSSSSKSSSTKSSSSGKVAGSRRVC